MLGKQIIIELDPPDVPAGDYVFKVNKRKTTTKCDICSKLTIKRPERGQ